MSLRTSVAGLLVAASVAAFSALEAAGQQTQPANQNTAIQKSQATEITFVDVRDNDVDNVKTKKAMDEARKEGATIFAFNPTSKEMANNFMQQLTTSVENLMKKGEFSGIKKVKIFVGGPIRNAATSAILYDDVKQRLAGNTEELSTMKTEFPQGSGMLRWSCIDIEPRLSEDLAKQRELLTANKVVEPCGTCATGNKGTSSTGTVGATTGTKSTSTAPVIAAPANQDKPDVKLSVPVFDKSMLKKTGLVTADLRDKKPGGKEEAMTLAEDNPGKYVVTVNNDAAFAKTSEFLKSDAYKGLNILLLRIAEAGPEAEPEITGYVGTVKTKTGAFASFGFSGQTVRNLTPESFAERMGKLLAVGPRAQILVQLDDAYKVFIL